MPVTPKVRGVFRHDDEMARALGDLRLAPGAHVVLAGLVRLDRGDENGFECRVRHRELSEERPEDHRNGDRNETHHQEDVRGCS